MSEFAARSGVQLRPHAKAHKCVEIARAQLARGATGICCQTVGEAEVFVEAGIGDVLVTNQVVDRTKLRRLAMLGSRAAVGVCVDDPEQVELLAEAVAGVRLTTPLRVLVEIDVGQHRCGIEPGEQAASLAELITTTPGLAFAGLQAYHGSAQHLRTPAERRAAMQPAGAAVTATLASLGDRGIECPTITGAGTGTFDLEATSSIWTEIQPGSYALMDADYARNSAEDGAPRFAHALHIYATVVSRAIPGQAVVDVGLKGLSAECGLPTGELLQPARPVEVLAVNDEHTVLRLGRGESVALGQRVALVPGHIDPTVNLHDWIVGVRAATVESLWRVAARSPGL